MIKKIINKYERFPKAAKASLWFLICSFMQKGISVITTPIFTRLLTTKEYGQYSVFNSWLTIVTAIVTLNLYYGVYTQGLIKFEEDKKIYTSSIQGLMLTLVASWTVVYLAFHNFFNSIFDLTTAQMLLMLLMIWTTGTFRLWAAEKRVVLEYRILVVVTLIVSFLKPALGVLLVVNAENKVLARIFGLAVVELAGYSWCFFYHLRKGKHFYSAKYWKYTLALNIPLIPHYLSQTVLSSADRIMIKHMVGDSEAGIYSLAYSISQIMTLFNTALKNTVSPWIYRKIKERRVEDLPHVVIPTVVVVAVVNILLIAFAPEAVAIFAPTKYYEAIWVIPPVAMSVYFLYLYPLFVDFEFYYEKTKNISVATLIGAGLNIVLNYLCINLFGYMAAGYTTLACYGFYVLFHYLSMKHICKKEFPGIDVYNFKLLFGITTVFMMLGFAFLVSYNFTILRYVMIIIIGFIMIIKRKAIVKYVREIAGMRK